MTSVKCMIWTNSAINVNVKPLTKKGKTEHHGIPMSIPPFADVIAGTRSPPLGDWVEWRCVICNRSLWQVNVG